MAAATSFRWAALMYEMITGRRAFSGDTKMSTITAILRDEPKPVSEMAPVPREFERIIARCLRKDPARRFQHIDDVKIALEELKEESDSGRLLEAERPVVPPRRTWALYAALACALALLTAAWIFWRSQRSSGVSSGLSLRQLTQESGYASMPAISPDGKLVAYASDRAGDAGLDIWVQQLNRGAQPIRLTRDKADDMWPSFSPDGGQIVFVSGREGGGVYVMPALGGDERLLMRSQFQFFQPRFLPMASS